MNSKVSFGIVAFKINIENNSVKIDRIQSAKSSIVSIYKNYKSIGFVFFVSLDYIF